MKKENDRIIFKSPEISFIEYDTDIWTEELERKRQYLKRLPIYQKRERIAKKILEEIENNK